ncbi:MAG: histidinol-phosphatase [Clostridia bacterium]|nr:histidinol-phosphatase [Clostridia bacterium]
MKTNYHTHTRRCGHAESRERAYVEAAVRQGFDVLGFADHVPMPYENFRSPIRMQPEETAEYVDTVKALREEFRGRITLHIGFEAEYFPALFDDFLRMLEPYDYEYLVLGQHFLNSEVGGRYMGAAFDSADTLDALVDQCAEGLHTGAFSCFAHPDLFHFTGEERVFRSRMRRLCREAKACGVPLEFNLLGAGLGRNYPNPAFWEEAAAVGNQVIIGWDAHSPAWLERSDLEAQATSFLDSLGLRRIDSLALIRPRPRF